MERPFTEYIEGPKLRVVATVNASGGNQELATTRWSKLKSEGTWRKCDRRPKFEGKGSVRAGFQGLGRTGLSERNPNPTKVLHLS